jgi:hypothetical protein
MASTAEEGHVAMLTEFYAKHDSSKTAAQIQKLAAKHTGGGKFETLCGKMKQKYGESPREVWEAVQREAAGGVAQTAAAAEGGVLSSPPRSRCAQEDPHYRVIGAPLYCTEVLRGCTVLSHASSCAG